MPWEGTIFEGHYLGADVGNFNFDASSGPINSNEIMWLIGCGPVNGCPYPVQSVVLRYTLTTSCEASVVVNSRYGRGCPGGQGVAVYLYLDSVLYGSWQMECNTQTLISFSTRATIIDIVTAGSWSGAYVYSAIDITTDTCGTPNTQVIVSPGDFFCEGTQDDSGSTCVLPLEVAAETCSWDLNCAGFGVSTDPAWEEQYGLYYSYSSYTSIYVLLFTYADTVNIVANPYWTTYFIRPCTDVSAHYTPSAGSFVLPFACAAGTFEPNCKGQMTMTNPATSMTTGQTLAHTITLSTFPSQDTAVLFTFNPTVVFAPGSSTPGLSFSPTPRFTRFDYPGGPGQGLSRQVPHFTICVSVFRGGFLGLFHSCSFCVRSTLS